MKKFQLIQCVKQVKEENQLGNGEGYVVGLASFDDPNIIFYFPIPEEEAVMVNYLLDPEGEKDSKPNTKMLGLYNTMMEGFASSGTFVSASILNFEIDENKEEILYCISYLSNIDTGFLESTMITTFNNAIMFSAIKDMDIFITDELCEKILSTLESSLEKAEKEEQDKKKKFPKDKNIDKIAKKIMNGKIKK